MSEVIDASYTESAPLAVREEHANPPTLFGTTDPVEVIAQATRVADALKAVVVAKRLVSTIQGKEYPHVEAWQTIGIMLGLTAVNEWSRRTENGGGWEARANVVNGHGRVIGSAEAQCCKTERGKGGWEDYALRSMAQTRATSKAFRSVLSFVMVLAGYEPTPAEEMTEAPVAPPTPAKAISAKRILMFDMAKATGMDDGERKQLLKASMGVSTSSDLTEEQVIAFTNVLEEYVPEELRAGVRERHEMKLRRRYEES